MSKLLITMQPYVQQIYPLLTSQLTNWKIRGAMEDKIFVDRDYSLAAVKFKGYWRFFYDIQTMFLLDYTSYEPDYTPLPGDWRYGSLIVGDDNAEQWIDALAGELTQEEIPKTYWQGTLNRIRLTFMIDFDERVWIGEMWEMDQSPLQDYQPEGWLAEEDALGKWLPPEIWSYWA